MPSLMTQRTQPTQGRTPWLPCAWHTRVLLGFLVVLMSLCHGVVAPASVVAAAEGPAAVAVVTDEHPPLRDCAAGKRLVALSERRGPAALLDLPGAATVLTAYLPEAARGLRMVPPPIPGKHRAFLQVFRI